MKPGRQRKLVRHADARSWRWAACWLAMAAVVPWPAEGQCIGELCPIRPAPHPAVARVAHVTPGGSRSYGSGTLVHRDGDRGIVLSCAHLFRPGTGRVQITFADGRWLPAELLAVDEVWDLAALAVATCPTSPVSVAADYPRPGDWLRSCGYGPDGRYRCNQGRALGYAKPAAAGTFETLQLSGFARDGDSGGPVFNQSGELAAVVWGTDGRTVGGTYCGRIRKFLARILLRGRVPGEQPQPSPRPPEPSAPVPSSPSAPDGLLHQIRERLEGLAGKLDQTERQRDQRSQAWNRRLEALEKGASLLAALKGRIEKAEAAVGTESLRGLVREVALGIVADRAPGLAQTMLPALLTALGWTGPPSIAMILAIRLAAGILRRRLAGRSQPVPGNRRGQSTQPGRLNDEYAEQLARVHALSGRSPIADATLGREYDEELRQAEAGSDAALARWAGNLRRCVARRFYRIHGESPLPAEPPDGAEPPRVGQA